MRKLETRIGSPIWRLRNYGLRALVIYLWFDKVKGRRSTQINQAIIRSNAELCEYLDTVTGIKVESSTINSSIESFCEKFIQANRSVGGSKKSASDLVSTRTRLLVLASVSLATQPQVYLETGTQHGTTSSFMAKEFSGLITEMYSVDVSPMPRILSSDKIRYLILARKPRKSLIGLSRDLREKSTLFFHDSDHSFENMSWELDFAWNTLGAKAVVFDDALGNRAFVDFVNQNRLKSCICQFDDGPAVGIIVR